MAAHRSRRRAPPAGRKRPRRRRIEEGRVYFTNEPPLACRLARDGDAVALIELLEATKGRLDPRHRDATATGRPLGAGSRLLAALLELMPARRVTRAGASTGSAAAGRCSTGPAAAAFIRNVALLLRTRVPELPTADGRRLHAALYAASVGRDLLREAGAAQKPWGCRDAHWRPWAPTPAWRWPGCGVCPERAWRECMTEPQAQGHTVFHKAASAGGAGHFVWYGVRGRRGRVVMALAAGPRGGLLRIAAAAGTATRRRSWRGPRREWWSRGVSAGGARGGARPRSRAVGGLARCEVFFAVILCVVADFSSRAVTRLGMRGEKKQATTTSRPLLRRRADCEANISRRPQEDKAGHSNKTAAPLVEASLPAAGSNPRRRCCSLVGRPIPAKRFFARW